MAEFTRGELKLAFSWHIAREILLADLEMAESEQAWLARTFPGDQLVDAGFVDANGQSTTRYEEALGESLTVLPEALELDEKLALITTLFEGTLADDEFHHGEGDVLVKAARLLGVSAAALDDHLGTLDVVGEVDLDEPEQP